MTERQRKKRVKLKDDSKVHSNYRAQAYQHDTSSQDRSTRDKSVRHKLNQFEIARMIAMGLNEVDLASIPKNTRKILLHDYSDQSVEIQSVLIRRPEPVPVVQPNATWITTPSAPVRLRLVLCLLAAQLGLIWNKSLPRNSRILKLIARQCVCVCAPIHARYNSLELLHIPDKAFGRVADTRV